jgi:hypothetical protein
MTDRPTIFTIKLRAEGDDAEVFSCSARSAQNTLAQVQPEGRSYRGGRARAGVIMLQRRPDRRAAWRLTLSAIVTGTTAARWCCECRYMSHG